MSALTFAPLVPWWLMVALGTAVVIGAAMRLRASPFGAVLRLLCGFAILGYLAGPALKTTDGEDLSDVALLLVDESVSMRMGGRDVVALDAANRLTSQIEARGVEVRRSVVDGTANTDLGDALTTALSDVPRARLSGIFVLTDGQLTDVPDPASLGLDVPIHAFLMGDPNDQIDRRVRIVRAPRYGVVGETATVSFEVVERGRADPVPIIVSVGGEAVLSDVVVPNEEVELAVPLGAPGETVIELAVPSVPGELTARNNRVAIRVTAIRDRLRVLLVSGEPHAGERVWRNILKSDPAVDLVHFTILKPFEKDTVASDPRELNLIAFPHEELFLDKLPEFDVVIFDRYTYRGVLQPYEFERVAAYVQAGGAVLVAAGPELSGRDSLAGQRSLARILPIEPTGRAVQEAFLPALSEIGRRHPVTAGLDAEPWGRWLRYMPVDALRGEVVIEGPSGAPLLVLAREGEGRVAVLASDHVWLWSRGFDGGGPHRELLRRLVHWLMQEPMLEEEAVSGRVDPDGTLVITRRTLAAAPLPADIERPDGATVTAEFAPDGEGLFTATATADLPGLYRVRTTTSGGRALFAVAASGESMVRELDDVLTTDASIAPLSEATGGLIAVLADASASLPSVRRVRANSAVSGSGWTGLVRRNAEAVTAVRSHPALPRWAWLMLSLGFAVTAWLAEGRRRSR